MDGKGRGVDNVFVERLWKSVKYERVYLHAYDSVLEAKRRLASYFEFYNNRAPALFPQRTNAGCCILRPRRLAKGSMMLTAGTSPTKPENLS